MSKSLDVITIGRSSLDLYGAPVVGQPENMGAFEKCSGGLSTDIAAGTARPGMAAALITRDRHEHLGRVIREELAQEGVDLRGVMLETIRPKARKVGETPTAELTRRFYDRGICPDWWKPEPVASVAARHVTVDATERNDADTRGIVVPELTATERMVKARFEEAALSAGQRLCRGSNGLWRYRRGMDAKPDNRRAGGHAYGRSHRRLRGHWDTARAAAGEE